MEFDDVEGRMERGFSQIHSSYREKEAHYPHLRLVHFTKPGKSISKFCEFQLHSLGKVFQTPPRIVCEVPTGQKEKES